MGIKAAVSVAQAGEAVVISVPDPAKKPKGIRREDNVIKMLKVNIRFVRGPESQGHKADCRCEHCERPRILARELKNMVFRYRYCVRTVAAIYMAALLAGAEVDMKDGYVRIVPGRDPILDEHGQPLRNKEGKIVYHSRGLAILDLLFNRQSKKPLYCLRTLIIEMLQPSFPNIRELLQPERTNYTSRPPCELGMSGSIADVALQDVMRVWKATDPQNDKLTREYRYINDVRQLPKFAHIGLPLRKSYIKLAHNDDGSGRGHWVTLKVLPGDAEFQMKLCGNQKSKKMDSSRWATICNLQSGEWPMGDPIRLDMEDGKFVLYIPYATPKRSAEVNQNRVLELAFTADRGGFIQFRMREGSRCLRDELRYADISSEAAIAQIDRIAKQQDKADARRRAGVKGSERIVIRSERTRQERVTQRREHAARDWNHRWAKRAIEVAASFRCATIQVFDLPRNAREEDEDESELPKVLEEAVEPRQCGLFGRTWPFYDFKTKLNNKAEERGLKTVWPEPPKKKKNKKEVEKKAETPALATVS